MKPNTITMTLVVCVLAAGALAERAVAAQARLPETFEMFVAPVGPKNPRNSEAAIIQRKDGALLLAWTEFYAGQGADHGPARIAGKLSLDGGQTWGRSSR